MDMRKIQRVGQNTLAVSLPKRWTEKVGLSKGDVIVFEDERDESLRLMPSESAKDRESPRIYVIDADECPEARMLERVIVGNYVLGRDIIWVVSKKRLRGSQVKEARAITTKLMGLAMMEETSNRILLQCSIDPEKFPIHALIRRLYLISSTMQREAIQALIDSDWELAEVAIGRESEADTLYWLVVRLLISSQRDRRVGDAIGLKHSGQILGYRTISMRLERIADWGEIIARDVTEIKEYRDEIGDDRIDDISALSELSLSVCSSAMDCLYTGDVRLANAAIGTYETGVEKNEEKFVRELARGLSGTHVVPYLRRIALALRRIGELGAEISETTMNMVLEGSSELCRAHLEREARKLGLTDATGLDSRC